MLWRKRKKHQKIHLKGQGKDRRKNDLIYLASTCKNRRNYNFLKIHHFILNFQISLSSITLSFFSEPLPSVFFLSLLSTTSSIPFVLFSPEELIVFWLFPWLHDLKFSRKSDFLPLQPSPMISFGMIFGTIVHF